MSDLPTAYHPVSVRLEMPVKNERVLGRVGRSDPLRWLITIKRHPFGTVEIPARALGIKTVQKTCPGRSALGSIAVSIGEQDTLLCQGVQVRGFALRVPAHRTDPIIQVINDNKDHVWLLFRLCKRESTQEYQSKSSDDYVFFIHGNERGY